MLMLRTFGTWLLVTIAMIVNGAFRVTILQPWLGERVADIVSAGLGIGLILTYIQWSSMDVGVHLRQHWKAGLLGAIILSLVMVWGVLRQPASSHSQGWELLFVLVWLGLVYGTLDSVFLTVMPVLAVQQMLGACVGGDDGASPYVRMWASLGASLLVTAAYHWGFVEFRGAQVVSPLIGNALITSGYLVTGSPFTPVVAHIAMHIAAVLHGMETTVQLPPHSH
jgi:hypothetical protein